MIQARFSPSPSPSLLNTVPSWRGGHILAKKAQSVYFHIFLRQGDSLSPFCLPSYVRLVIHSFHDHTIRAICHHMNQWSITEEGLILSFKFLAGSHKDTRCSHKDTRFYVHASPSVTTSHLEPMTQVCSRSYLERRYTRLYISRARISAQHNLISYVSSHNFRGGLPRWQP